MKVATGRKALAVAVVLTVNVRCPLNLDLMLYVSLRNAGSTNANREPEVRAFPIPHLFSGVFLL